jgi:ubiquinone/menaquinone biosynthesis C-methylase UbiE
MSFSEYPDAPDKESSTADYQSRFRGDVGQWFLERQAGITTKILRRLSETRTSRLRVLDVGGGHAQNVQTVLSEGHSLTVLGSDASCGQLVAGISSPEFCFRTGQLLDMPFADDEFDLVLSYRVMAHIGDWQQFARELHRVAKYCVAIDYPTLRSVNAFSAALYFVKKRAEKNTRQFRLFAESEIHNEMAAAGLNLHKRHPQFFFPMALHRMLRLRTVSAVLEAVAATVGPTRFFGSPVIAEYRKDDD